MSTATKEVEVKETGMIFQPHSIAAINEGRKTQTRRVVKHPLGDDIKFAHEDGGGNWIFWSGAVAADMAAFTKEAYPNGEGIVCPYGRRDDLIYVKEGVWAYMGSGSFHYSSDEPPPKDSSHFGFQWHAHQMPKSAARLWLVITNVRAERLQDISAKDCVSEGVMLRRWLQEDRGEGLPWLDVGLEAEGRELRQTFKNDWDSINAKRGYSWANNPWVWCLSFRRIDAS